MNGSTTIASLKNLSATDWNAPAVLLDGVPETGLKVVRFEARHALDQRAAVIDDTRREHRERASLHNASIALPLRLEDGTVRWQPLVNAGVARRLERSADRTIYRLDDAWSMQLDRVMRSWWWLSAQDQPVQSDRPARMRIGAAANASTQACTVNGAACRVLQDKGQPWTVGSALAYLSASAALGLRLGQIPGRVVGLALSREIDLSKPVGDALEQVLAEGGLAIHRESAVDPHREEVRVVRVAGNGRSVTLPSRVRIDTSSQASLARMKGRSGAQHWVALAPGQLVEFTAELVGGWDPSLQDEADTTYEKSAGVSFTMVRDVFRLWALNEDGHFTNAPFERGPAFDLSTLFAQRIEPQRLTLESCLTIDASGQGLEPIVEVSVDAGGNWSRHTGALVLRSDRAAVYLDDTVLASGWIDAVRAGAARVRVTASLRCPVPVSVDRWTGNAFAGAAQDRVLQSGGAFEFSRVDDSSVHASAIRSGALQAVESDPTMAMQHWLDTKALIAASPESLSQSTGLPKSETASLKLSGALPWLRIGDRLVLPGERDGAMVRVASFVCHWPANSSAPRTDVTIVPA